MLKNAQCACGATARHAWWRQGHLSTRPSLDA